MLLTRLLPGFIARFAQRLRFPSLFLLTTFVFIVDLFVPDLLPFADEILLGLGALILARWKKRKEVFADDVKERT